MQTKDQDKCSIREFGRYIGLSDTAIKKQMFDSVKNPSGPLRASITINGNNNRPMLFKELALTEWVGAGLTIKDKDVLAKLTPLIGKPSGEVDLPWTEKQPHQPSGQQSPAPKEEPKIPLGTEGNLVYTTMGGYAAKEMKELYVAGKHELEYRKMLGQLVEKDAVYKLLFEFGQEIRSNLQQIPARVMSQIMACETERDGKEILNAEIEKVLFILARGPKVYEQTDEQDTA